MTDTFRGFIEFGREIMQGVRTDDPDAVRYKWLLGEINSLFAKTHEIVLKRLEAIEKAQTAQEALGSIKQLRGEALSNSFHAQGLCDVFVGLGNALSSLNWRLQSRPAPAGDSASRSSLLAHADDLAQRLQKREYEVALMYRDQIRQLSELLDTDAGGSLQEMQAKAKVAKREIIGQIADFSQLANDFKSIELT
jgi:hypothetical protein